MARARDDEHRSALDERMRLDKWLWAARFFKTRQLAIDAINGGKVHLNGQRAKPGKEIGTGAKLRISKDQYMWDITVLALSGQRRPAAEAALLYEETPESIAQRQAEVARRRDENSLALQPETKPNKKDRRLIHRFKRGPE
ncbi:RNA-binding S4 domain-containing protein [Methylocaldum sp.]|uniref:RNA-binding S4 domain-containing protein n=1 Tax=Methylocaldum sp. TaxID=1969727 RepID=UPI002D5F09E3|nr:S4 domain-containing protein [Methylocaldum sp.]HYE35568.1 S4 domain-containing protein [Methylocaldum sp.]